MRWHLQKVVETPDTQSATLHLICQCHASRTPPTLAASRLPSLVQLADKLILS